MENTKELTKWHRINEVPTARHDGPVLYETWVNPSQDHPYGLRTVEVRTRLGETYRIRKDHIRYNSKTEGIEESDDMTTWTPAERIPMEEME